MVWPAISFPALNRVCRSAQVICAGSPARMGPVFTKKVACMLCACRIGKPWVNWSTVPSSNPSVTTTGVLAAAGTAGPAQVARDVVSAAAASQIRLLGRVRWESLTGSPFIGLPSLMRGLRPSGHLPGECERRRGRQVDGGFGVRERLHVVLPLGVVAVELCEGVGTVGGTEVHATDEPAGRRAVRALHGGAGQHRRGAIEVTGQVRDLMLQAVRKYGAVADDERRAPGVRAQ